MANDMYTCHDEFLGLRSDTIDQGETINNENDVTIKNKPKCIEEVDTLSVLPIYLSPHDFEINILPDISLNLPVKSEDDNSKLCAWKER
ncbi:hypothetical protein TNCV_4307121 [Trichonephila clavipes]|nr:hypothetical protein TNCV_4307121 [Trichonephila clavipes]